MFAQLFGETSPGAEAMFTFISKKMKVVSIKKELSTHVDEFNLVDTIMDYKTCMDYKGKYDSVINELKGWKRRQVIFSMDGDFGTTKYTSTMYLSNNASVLYPTFIDFQMGDEQFGIKLTGLIMCTTPCGYTYFIHEEPAENEQLF